MEHGMMQRDVTTRLAFSVGLMSLYFMSLSPAAQAETIKYQVTGLFMKEREQDLRDAVANIPEVKVVSVDFDNAEATFEYDAAKAFPGIKPDQVMQRFDSLLKNASSHTFGIKPLCSVPREKLRFIEIPIAGLDCKACSLGAYNAVYQLEGVERATASFREGRVTVWIDPTKTDRTKLEAALKKRGVEFPAR
jgi:cation transport ATPase